MGEQFTAVEIAETTLVSLCAGVRNPEGDRVRLEAAQTIISMDLQRQQQEHWREVDARRGGEGLASPPVE
jgi:hypothetical protein